VAGKAEEHLNKSIARQEKWMETLLGLAIALLVASSFVGFVVVSICIPTVQSLAMFLYLVIVFVLAAVIFLLLLKRNLRSLPSRAALIQCVEAIDKIASEDLPATTAVSNFNAAALEQTINNLVNKVQELGKRERAMIDNAVDIICVVDREACFVSASPSCERFWGYSREWLVGKKLTDLIEAEDVAKTIEALQTILGAQKSITQINWENRFKTKAGKTMILEWTAHWSAGDNHLFCIAHDISKRKKAEERLQESELQLRTTLEAMPVGIASSDSDGTIEYANESLERFTGIEISKLAGTAIDNLVPAKQQTELRKYLEKCRSNESVDSFESELVRVSGEGLPVDICASTFRIQGNQKLLITFSDISQRKEIERLRQEFVAMINHDLKAPLTSFTGFVQRIENGAYGELNEAGKEVCKTANDELQRLMRLIGDLLDLDKMQSGNLEIRKEEVAVLDIIEASVSSLRTFAEINQISIEYPETEAACWADRRRIIQVLVNLLSNAIKFSPANSKIEITVLESNAETKISVQDKGEGIPPEKAAILFKRYKQVNAYDLTKRAGSGLGLSICKAIVEAHNGHIGYERNLPEGSTFWFLLPNKETE